MQFVHALSYEDKKTGDRVFIYEDHHSLFDCQMMRRVLRRQKKKGIKVEGYFK